MAGVIAEMETGCGTSPTTSGPRGRRSVRRIYSFEVAVRDVDAVLAARGVDRALLVGWSYGAFVAAHWASRHPDRTVGAVLVDGANPYDWLDEAMEQRIRKMFRRLNWFLPLLRPTGLAPRMTPNSSRTATSSSADLPRTLAGPRAGRIPSRAVLVCLGYTSSEAACGQKSTHSLGR